MSNDNSGQIDVEQKGRVLYIGINRPSKYNGFTPEMLSGVAAAYTKLEESEELWCGLVYAVGDHFSAGLDLPKTSELRKKGLPLVPTQYIDPFNLRGPRRTKPVLMAVKGICFTVAVELMLAADIVIAADNCRFSQMEVKRGIMAGCGATFRFVERAGWGNAMKLLLTGQEFSAEEAYRINFVQEVVATGEELARASEIANEVCRQAPLAIRATMKNSLMAIENGWESAYSEIQDIQKGLYNSQDAKEGMRSFLEKRSAMFTGG